MRLGRASAGPWPISAASWAADLKHRKWEDAVSLCKKPSGDPRGYLEEIFKETGGPTS